ncbi:MAG: hypothetical protein KDM63_13220 [Verrucomicrobiae bacterium]|nr:hypothetical protein [Verrucomicrobiae bacterium]
MRRNEQPTRQGRVSDLTGFGRIVRPILIACGVCMTAALAGAQENSPQKLGILLDVSAEMGFLVPQARKEIRWLNEALIARQRQPLPVVEFSGASLEREGSLSVPARKNAYYALHSLLNERSADGVYWLTALKGQQSGDGFFAAESLLKGEAAKQSKPLIIRHLWQKAGPGRPALDHPAA